jgi:hypothetical protein
MHFETGTPKACEALSPGLQGTSYLGDTVRKALNPAGGCISGRGSFDSTPEGLAPFGENPG